jgi:site-specific recombinase XerD
MLPSRRQSEQLEVPFLMKLSKAIEGYKLVSLAEGFSPRTMEGYEWALGRLTKFFKSKGMDDPELDEIGSAELHRFFLLLRTDTDLAPASIRSVWRTIRSFYNWATKTTVESCSPLTISEFKKELKKGVRITGQLGRYL